MNENDPRNHDTPRLTHAGLILEKVLAKGLVGEKQDFLKLAANFENLFGKHLAMHLQLVDFKDSLLFLHASSAVWKSETEYAKKAIIAKCNGFLGAPRIKGIRFI